MSAETAAKKSINFQELTNPTISMIFGECPYEDCDGSLHLALAESHVGGFQRHNCETCGRQIWTFHSRWNPHSYTQEDFEAKYDVDEKTREITEKTP